MKVKYLLLILFLEHSFAQASYFKVGQIYKATVSQDFKVNQSLKGFPVLISFGWNKPTKKEKKEKKEYSNCLLVANANPDFIKNKSYLYIDRIECDKKNIDVSAYVTDTALDFGINSKIIYFNNQKYLKVEGGRKVFIVVTKVSKDKIQISDSVY